jgi:arylsulfatase A-like enzyme
MNAATRFLAAMTVAGVALTASAEAPKPSDVPKMNVLFLAVDDLRPQLGCYGVTDIRTPNIDRLAGEGLLFTHAYCQQAVCSPSRTSLLTGRRPDTTKVYDLVKHFRDTIPDVVTLPQHFKDNGWLCQSFGKIYHGGLEGTSFAPVIQDPKRPWKKAAFSQYPRPNLMGYAMRSDRHRYVEWIDSSARKVEGRELYDHRNDPDENVNLANQPAQADTVRELSAMLKAGWKAAQPRSD